MRHIATIFLPIGLSFILLTGCTEDSKNDTSSNSNITTLESNLARNLAPQVSHDELLTLADSNNQFAFTLFDKLYDNETGNIFFSPYSITEALAVVYAGANGDTKTEMASVLNFDINQEEQLHNRFNGLDLHLNQNDENYTFEVANAMWPQKDFPVLDSYLNTIKVNYGANVKTLDYVNQTEASRIAINNWVEEKTHERIKDIIPKGEIDETTLLVLTNAVYFKGRWQSEFYEDDTKNATFTAEDGSTHEIAFMNQRELYYQYFKTDNYQAINVPYQKNRSSMLIILPDEGAFSNAINNIERIYRQTQENMTSKNIALKMPKFEFHTPLYNIKEYLKMLGMNQPFLASADFSNLSNTTLKIDAVLHKAFIKVDEKGTEATAATVVIDANVTKPPEPIVFNINRPFIFFIKDTLSGQILFMGVMRTPAT
ncbi:MAG: serpin family protein [Sulfurimonas sp.]|nr:MAG: serpin family protein [Sulfurimonas sp.]